MMIAPPSHTMRCKMVDEIIIASSLSLRCGLHGIPYCIQYSGGLQYTVYSSYGSIMKEAGYEWRHLCAIKVFTLFKYPSVCLFESLTNRKERLQYFRPEIELHYCSLCCSSVNQTPSTNEEACFLLQDVRQTKRSAVVLRQLSCYESTIYSQEHKAWFQGHPFQCSQNRYSRYIISSLYVALAFVIASSSSETVGAHHRSTLLELSCDDNRPPSRTCRGRTQVTGENLEIWVQNCLFAEKAAARGGTTPR